MNKMTNEEMMEMVEVNFPMAAVSQILSDEEE